MSNHTKKHGARYMTHAALTAAIYVALTYISFVFGISGGVIQVRISEALCVLPFFTAAAVPGLFIGCIISNLISGAALFDVIFGSLATLFGAFAASRIKKHKYAVPIPNIIFNSLIIPPILIFVYHAEQSAALIFISVAAGEILSSYVLGIPLMYALCAVDKKYRLFEK